jgi:uncharacterized protein
MKHLLIRAYRLANRTLHSGGSQFEHANVADTSGLELLPINPVDVRQGSPVARAKRLNESGDGGMATGMWDCTAGRFRWMFHCDEVVHILEGEVTVQVDGKQHDLRAGSVAFFPIGTDSEWTVPRYVRKVYFHRHPSPMAKRALGV